MPLVLERKKKQDKKPRGNNVLIPIINTCNIDTYKIYSFQQLFSRYYSYRPMRWICIVKSETDQRETSYVCSSSSAVYNLDAQCADSSLGEIQVLALYVMHAFLWYGFPS